MGERLRQILQNQGLYVGVEHQVESPMTRESLGGWHDAGGGGDFFDMSPKHKAIFETFASKYGAKVIVYSNGDFEKIGFTTEQLVGIAKQKLSDIEGEEAQIGGSLTSERAAQIKALREIIEPFLRLHPSPQMSPVELSSK